MKGASSIRIWPNTTNPEQAVNTQVDVPLLYSQISFKDPLPNNICSSNFVMHLNIRGLSEGMIRKLYDIEILLESVKQSVKVICLNEHWLKSENISLLNKLTGYKLATSFCRTNGYGGSCILVHSTVDYDIRQNFSHLNEEGTFESCCIELKDYNTLIISIYRTPGYHISSVFLDKFDTLLHKLKCEKLYKKVVICADFNIDVRTNDKFSSHLKNLVATNGLNLNFDQYTRITASSATCIDNIVSSYNYYVKEKFLLDLGVSDHKALFVSLPKQNSVCTTKRCRNFSQENVEVFCKKLSQTKWTVSKHTSTSDNYNNFLTEFLGIFNECFPFVTVKTRSQKSRSWVTKEIRVSSATKRKLHMEAKVNRSPQFLKYVSTYKKTFDKIVKLAKRTANNDFISNAKNKSKAVWSVIRSEVGSEAERKCPSKIVINGRAVTEPSAICESFNDFFINCNKFGDCSPTNTKPNMTDSNCTCFKFSHVSISDVIKIIMSLKNSKSAGWDEVPIEIIKIVRHSIAYPLSFIINQSFDEGCFPDRLKYAEVRPIHKKGKQDELGNYRPISLLPIFSKIFERAACDQIENHNSSNSIILGNQYGFRKGRSTIHAINELVTKVSRCLDDRMCVSGIFCDLSKAFDTVNHDLLLQKLARYGFQGKSLSWMSSYLANRKQRVLININGKKFLSGWKITQLGVPQGSILGPLLFLYYINDMPCQVQSDTILYADDSTAVVCCKNEVDLIRHIEQTLGEVEAWVKNNNLTLNFTKTEIVHFTTKQSAQSISEIRYMDKKLETADCVKFLGMLVNKNLLWSHHVDNILGRLNSLVYIMNILYSITDLAVRKTVYNAYFVSVIRYSIIFWGSEKTNLLRAFRLQKRII
ncbi:uncharacterized protein LOC126195196 [Schistocerca nitens]|uniref:uncharacterized protein LOC126195196 n=1 Tax=Schistocerca nitens TaxID=7011 RepID=UPI002118E4E9|nr:uncharacterized protein LOC126195196 [Schistocerca nitens]XP_049789669.1 uncharacterized protein LOC126195196 [Schistocerca nitens]